jgi:glucose-6-phosphate 1-dehydrogenase
MKVKHTPCGIFTIFGATGDLSRRKILPALFALYRQGRIGDDCLIVGVARESGLGDDGYRALVRQVLAGIDDDAVAHWVDRCLFYHTIGGSTPGDYQAIGAKLSELEKQRSLPGNRVFYLAIPPGVFRTTIEGLGEAGLNHSPGWTRIVIEKPFGRDYQSALELNKLVHRYFDESQIYRIDHYLGKETVQNLLVFRFSNAVFESLWNRDHVAGVQITVAEDIGIGKRAGYYEKAGAVRDIIQNHGTQLLALVAMEVPATFDAESIRFEKIKALRSVALIDSDEVVLGQYTGGVIGGQTVAGYREEPGVSPDSRTETYAALKLEVDSWRWQGVPFYIRTGKRLPQRLTEIVIHFRRPPVWMFESMGPCEIRSNILKLTIQPDEGFALYFNAKAPGQPLELKRLPLDFQYKEQFKELPEAYQTLLLEVLEGDQTLFVHADEVEAAWKLYAPILEGNWPVHPYPAGTWGPPEADRLLAADGRQWREH